MHSTVTIICLILSICWASAADAQDTGRREPQSPFNGPYVGATIGVEFLKRGSESNLGFVYGGMAGYRMPVSDRIILGAYGLLTESTTSEFDLSQNLNTNVAETWSLGGSVGYVFYSDYLVSLEIGYLETNIQDAGPIRLNPISPGQDQTPFTPDPDLFGTQSGARFALVFERPLASRVHTRSQVSRTELGSLGQRWSFDLGLVVQF